MPDTVSGASQREGIVGEQNNSTERKQGEDFEAALGSLEAIVHALEAGDLPLEEALKRFEEGTRLLRRCESALKAAEQRVEILLAEGREDGPTPFKPDE